MLPCNSSYQLIEYIYQRNIWHVIQCLQNNVSICSIHGGDTPLHACVRSLSADLLLLLLESSEKAGRDKVDLNVCTSDATPLHLAVSLNSITCAAILLRCACVEPNFVARLLPSDSLRQKTSFACTPLDVALFLEHHAMARLLLLDTRVSLTPASFPIPPSSLAMLRAFERGSGSFGSEPRRVLHVGACVRATADAKLLRQEFTSRGWAGLVHAERVLGLVGCIQEVDPIEAIVSCRFLGVPFLVRLPMSCVLGPWAGGGGGAWFPVGRSVKVLVGATLNASLTQPLRLPQFCTGRVLDRHVVCVRWYHTINDACLNLERTQGSMQEVRTATRAFVQATWDGIGGAIVNAIACQQSPGLVARSDLPLRRISVVPPTIRDVGHGNESVVPTWVARPLLSAWAPACEQHEQAPVPAAPSKLPSHSKVELLLKGVAEQPLGPSIADGITDAELDILMDVASSSIIEVYSIELTSDENGNAIQGAPAMVHCSVLRLADISGDEQLKAEVTGHPAMWRPSTVGAVVQCASSMLRDALVELDKEFAAAGLPSPRVEEKTPSDENVISKPPSPATSPTMAPSGELFPSNGGAAIRVEAVTLPPPEVSAVPTSGVTLVDSLTYRLNSSASFDGSSVRKLISSTAREMAVDNAVASLILYDCFVRLGRPIASASSVLLAEFIESLQFSKDYSGIVYESLFLPADYIASPVAAEASSKILNPSRLSPSDSKLETVAESKSRKASVSQGAGAPAGSNSAAAVNELGPSGATGQPSVATHIEMPCDIVPGGTAFGAALRHLAMKALGISPKWLHDPRDKHRDFFGANVSNVVGSNGKVAECTMESLRSIYTVHPRLVELISDTQPFLPEIIPAAVVEVMCDRVDMRPSDARKLLAACADYIKREVLIVVELCLSIAPQAPPPRPPTPPPPTPPKPATPTEEKKPVEDDGEGKEGGKDVSDEAETKDAGEKEENGAEATEPHVPKESAETETKASPGGSRVASNAPSKPASRRDSVDTTASAASAFGAALKPRGTRPVPKKVVPKEDVPDSPFGATLKKKGDTGGQRATIPATSPLSDDSASDNPFRAALKKRTPGDAPASPSPKKPAARTAPIAEDPKPDSPFGATLRKPRPLPKKLDDVKEDDSKDGKASETSSVGKPGKLKSPFFDKA